MSFGFVLKRFEYISEYIISRYEYIISKDAVEIFLQFCTTYLCEQSISSLLLIKNDKRFMLKSS